jgi:hypothetical protein
MQKTPPTHTQTTHIPTRTPTRTHRHTRDLMSALEFAKANQISRAVCQRVGQSGDLRVDGQNLCVVFWRILSAQERAETAWKRGRDTHTDTHTTRREDAWKLKTTHRELTRNNGVSVSEREGEVSVVLVIIISLIIAIIMILLTLHACAREIELRVSKS